MSPAAERRRRPIQREDGDGSSNTLHSSSAAQSSIFQEGPAPAGEARVEGRVIGIIFDRAPEYMVFRVEPDDRMGESVTVSAKGCPSLSVDLRVKAGGAWKSTRYGLQIEAAWVAPELSSLAVVAAGFLKTRVNGIGPVRASALVVEHGDRLPEILRDAAAIQRTKGIGEMLAQAIVEAWTAIGPEDMADLELAGMGVTEGARHSLLDKFGAGAAEAIKKNPWLAVKARGMGIADADRLALQLGVAFDCLDRAQAVVLDVVDKAATQGGSTRVSSQAVYEETLKRGVVDERTDEAVSALVADKDLVLHNELDEMSAAWLDKCERGIAAHMRRLVRTWAPRAAPMVPAMEGIVPTEEQVGAAVEAQRRGVMVISGQAGTGKTTIMRLVCDAFAACGMMIEGCSPTGRAADRLRESMGRPASTVHRLLEWTGGASWGRNRRQPLPPAVYVVDEFSMVDVALFWRLLEAIPDGSALLMVGDHRQLPSVGAGACLRDLIEARAVPVCTLTKIHRQAAGNPVIAGCHAVLAGKVPTPGQSSQGQLIVMSKRKDGEIVESPEQVADAIVASVRWIQAKGLGLRDIQVICPGKRSPCGVYEMNKRLRAVWLPDAPQEPRFVVGSPVMQLKNCRERNIWNGTVGVVRRLEVGPNGKMMDADIEWDSAGLETVESDQLDAGTVQECFASTIHKVQGSQYPWIVMPLHFSMGFPLHCQEIAYTGLSRAQIGAVVIGAHKTMSMTVRRSNGNERHTGLQQYLAEEMARDESDPVDSIKYRGEPDRDDQRQEWRRWMGHQGSDADVAF